MFGSAARVSGVWTKLDVRVCIYGQCMHTFLSLSGAFRPAMWKPGKLRHVVGRLCVLSRQFKHVMRVSGVFMPFVGMLGQLTRVVMTCRECVCHPGNYI